MFLPVEPFIPSSGRVLPASTATGSTCRLRGRLTNVLDEHGAIQRNRHPGVAASKRSADARQQTAVRRDNHDAGRRPGHAWTRPDGTTQRDGLTGSFNLTQTLQNGTVFGSIASTRNQNGQRLTFQFGRDLQLPNGALRGAIGVTSADIGDSAVIGSLSYSKQLPSGSISFNIGRSASTNGLNQEILDTRVGVNYGYVVSSVSQIGLSLDWGKSEDTNPIGGASTIERTDLTASYTHDLTSDWSLTSGMTYRMKTETGKADANSTALFVTLGRNFSFRP